MAQDREVSAEMFKSPRNASGQAFGDGADGYLGNGPNHVVRAHGAATGDARERTVRMDGVNEVAAQAPTWAGRIYGETPRRSLPERAGVAQDGANKKTGPPETLDPCFNGRRGARQDFRPMTDVSIEWTYGIALAGRSNCPTAGQPLVRIPRIHSPVVAHNRFGRPVLNDAGNMPTGTPTLSTFGPPYFAYNHASADILMPDFFLDIETVPDMQADEYAEASRRVGSGDLGPGSADSELYWKYAKGALKYTVGRTALVTYQVDRAPTRRLLEWKDGEEAVLKKLYTVIQDLQRDRGDDPLRIIGHNILGFDLFFLYNRMRILGIDEEAWLYNWVINGPVAVDFLQIHLPLNGMSAKGLKHDVLAHAYGLPTKDTSGGDEAGHYFRGEYQKILEYSRREFVYPEMFWKIVADGLVSSKRLAESIRWYEDLRRPAGGNGTPETDGQRSA